MSFNGNHFGEGFDIGTSNSNTFYNNVVKYGTLATWYRRTRGTKDTTTGHSPETWNTDKTLYIFAFTIADNRRETPAGEVVEQRHEVQTYVPIPKNDRLNWGGKNYTVELDPEPVYINNDEVYYRHIVMKRD